MKASYTRIGIGPLCVLFGKTRHAFYDKSWRMETVMEASQLALEMVAEIRREIPRIGTPKLYHMLKEPFKAHGIKMGRDALHSLLLDHGLTVKRRRKYIRTTDSHHWMKKYSNLIKGFIPEESEQLWVADITYIQIRNDFNYLSLITDAYSHRIVGHCLFNTLSAEGPLTALQKAIATRTKQTTLIHHSDRGTQYCSAGYVEILQQASIAISMTERGDPYENALAERVNGILKDDFDLSKEFDSQKQALYAVDKSIVAYNELRPHMSCDYMTPIAAHNLKGVLKKKWKNKSYLSSAHG
jgi:transposase InsO family protein